MQTIFSIVTSERFPSENVMQEIYTLDASAVKLPQGRAWRLWIKTTASLESIRNLASVENAIVFSLNNPNMHPLERVPHCTE